MYILHTKILSPSFFVVILIVYCYYFLLAENKYTLKEIQGHNFYKNTFQFREKSSIKRFFFSKILNITKTV